MSIRDDWADALRASRHSRLHVKELWCVLDTSTGETHGGFRSEREAREWAYSHEGVWELGFLIYSTKYEQEEGDG